MAPINKQIWTDTIMEGFIPDGSFLSESVDMTPLVEFNTINAAEAGIEPEVLFDNNTYPIPVASRDDIPQQLPLHTLDTKNTVVRNVEKIESSYDKLKSVTQGHKNSLCRKSCAYAAHAWAPLENGLQTPVQIIEGAASKLGYVKTSFDDFLVMEALYRSMDVPMDKLVAVLHPYHLADLMAEDKKLYKDVIASGKLFSFKLFSTSILPVYNASTKKKKAFGAAADPENDAPASITYCSTEVMRADGDIKMFLNEDDAAQRGDVIGFQKRFTALPIRGKYNGAIVTPKATV